MERFPTGNKISLSLVGRFVFLALFILVMQAPLRTGIAAITSRFAFVYSQPTVTTPITVADEWNIYSPSAMKWQRVSGFGGGRNDEGLGEANFAYADAEGRVWFPHAGAGLTMYDGKEWHHWHLPSGNLDSRSFAIGKGYVYLGLSGTGEGSVARLNLATNEWIYPWEPMGEIPMAMGNDSEGNIYYGGLGLYRDTGRNYTDYLGTCGLHRPSSSSAFYVSPDGQVFWGNGIVCHFDGNQWIQYDERHSDLFDDIAAFNLDTSGRLWVATTKRLLVRDTDGQWYVTGDAAMPERYYLQDVEIDNEGRLWLAEPETLTIFNGSEYLEYSSAQVGQQWWISGYGGWGSMIAMDTQQRMWFGMGNDGIIMHDGDIDLAPFDMEAFLATATPLDVEENIFK